MDDPICRACQSRIGHQVLDLGNQPACDYFPTQDDPGPDPEYPLQMWLCSCCGLAQLVADPVTPEEPKGAEPAALVAQAADAVGQVAAAGWLPTSGRVAEYGSPHGGSWLNLLADRGLTAVSDGEQADVVIDCFGMMHAANQSAALAERVGRVAPGGLLLLQYHSLSTILRFGQWNALRHGHYAYYSTTVLAGMLAAENVDASRAWVFDLYGGTVLLAAGRRGERADEQDQVLSSLVAQDEQDGVCDPAAVGRLQVTARAHAARLRSWLAAEREMGRTVLGYGAASRAVALLRMADVDRMLLPAVVDASPAKHGLRMPGTDIPVVSPARLDSDRPDAVLLFVADLRAEVRLAFPEVEAGGRWVDADSLGSFPEAVSGGL
ncbi:MAG: class I SAM-dependent methyltransferase [Streptosporangiaceae bacterium]